MPPAITAEQLSKTFRVKVRDPGLRGALEALLRPRYRDVHAVREVTFRIDPGEIVAFLGPNGAGKTTTLKMLAARPGGVPGAGGGAVQAGARAVVGRGEEGGAGRRSAPPPADPVPRRPHARARRDRAGGAPPLPRGFPRPPRRDGAPHVALHARRDGARQARPHHQPRPAAVRRCPGRAGGAHRAHQAAGAGARRRRRGHGRSPRGVRRGEEFPLPQRGARGAARGGRGDERAAARRASRRRPLDRGPADRGCDPPGVHPRRAGGRLVNRVADWARRYGALIRNAWLVDLQYRASIVLWIIWGVTEPTIALGIWWSIAGDGQVGGYARADFARYFFALMLVNQLTIAWDSWYLDRWIREGDLNYRLARPLHPAHEAVAENIAYKARSGGMILVVWLVAALVWPAVRLPLAPGRWTLTALAVLLAAAMRFFISFATGLLAFWTTRATAIMGLHGGVALFLSGRIAPLTLLPPAVAGVAAPLWFPYMLAFPVNLLTGSVHGTAALLHGFAGQIVWLALWVGAYRLAWTRGLRRYGAVGG